MYVTETITNNLIWKAVIKGNYEVLKTLGKKPYQFSRVEELMLGTDYSIIGCAVILNGNLESILEGTNEQEKPAYLLVRNKEELKTLEEFLESEKLEEENEKLEKAQTTDEKIKDTIRKYTPDDEEKVEDVFQLVRSAEGLNQEELKKQMAKVYKLGYNQNQTTAIFRANTKLNVNKNTFIAKNIEED